MKKNIEKLIMNNNIFDASNINSGINYYPLYETTTSNINDLIKDNVVKNITDSHYNDMFNNIIKSLH